VLQTEERRAQGGTYELRVSERAHACAAATAAAAAERRHTSSDNGGSARSSSYVSCTPSPLRICERIAPPPPPTYPHHPTTSLNHHPLLRRARNRATTARFRDFDPKPLRPLAFANARPYHHHHSCISPSPSTLISCGVHTRGGNSDSGRSSRRAATSAASAAASAARAVGHMYRSRNKGRTKRRAGEHE
jgi:hypothetical protein